MRFEIRDSRFALKTKCGSSAQFVSGYDLKAGGETQNPWFWDTRDRSAHAAQPPEIAASESLNAPNGANIQQGHSLQQDDPHFHTHILFAQPKAPYPRIVYVLRFGFET